MVKKMKVIGLIPSRLKSTRLKHKPLLKLGGIPMVIHTYIRAKLSKQLNDVIICCDDEKIKKICEKYNAKYMITRRDHFNGTERIAEAYLKINKKYDLVVDIQGDEPLIDPKNIDKVINFHKKNLNSDIILPTLVSKKKSTKNIVKVLINNKKEVMYLSRTNLPFNFKKKNDYFLKHLSIISFKPKKLIQFYKSKPTFAEKIEGVELLRALELGMKIKTTTLTGDSFSVDIKEQYIKAKKYILKDQYFKKYFSYK
jgi:3-deoxy-manno-octulosonate cytidylyltransferase (CMP-KDO synthetase)